MHAIDADATGRRVILMHKLDLAGVLRTAAAIVEATAEHVGLPTFDCRVDGRAAASDGLVGPEGIVAMAVAEVEADRVAPGSAQSRPRRDLERDPPQPTTEQFVDAAAAQAGGRRAAGILLRPCLSWVGGAGSPPERPGAWECDVGDLDERTSASEQAYFWRRCAEWADRRNGVPRGAAAGGWAAAAEVLALWAETGRASGFDKLACWGDEAVLEAERLAEEERELMDAAEAEAHADRKYEEYRDRRREERAAMGGRA